MAATPNVMADVKDWLLNKCRDASSLLAVDRLPVHGGRHLTYSNVVVTPDNIPEFTIPSSMDTNLGGSVSPGLETDLQSQSSSGGSVSSASGLRGSSLCARQVAYQQQSMTHRLVPTTATRSRSAPVSPMRSLPTDPNSDEVHNPSSPRFDDASSESSLLGHTNSDPMSLAALSLPHLKMRTLYGFETLTESPHTRRKESLFHDDSLADGAVQGLPLIGRNSKRKTPSSLETLAPQIIMEDVDRRNSGGRRHKRRHNVPAMIAPLGVVLSPNARVLQSQPQSLSCRGHSVGNMGDVGSSPATCGSCSSSHFCSCPEFNTYSTPSRPSPRYRASACERQHQQNLRRSSLKEENLLSRPCLISPEVSPSLLLRRNSGSHLLLSPHRDQENWDMLKAASTVSSSDGSSPCSSSCHSFSRCSEGGSPTGRQQELGQLRLSLLYLPKQRQLKVGLIRAENLTRVATETWSLPFHSGLSPKHSPVDFSPAEQKQEQLNPYVKLCLMPGKAQRCVSRVVRHTRNPVFGQDFVFNDLLRHEVPEMRLRLKVCHKTAKLGRDEVLGELQVNLAELIPSQETRLLRELEPVTNRHELGHIHISVCFYASAEKMTVAVHQVTDLSRHTFTGAPDPYVRVELTQPRRATTSHQTKTKKKNTAPVFNESFTFPISPKIEDLHYTSLTVTVRDHSTLRADGQIGQVRLGFGATEEAEFHHWNQVLQQPGRVATNWHLLMDPVSD